MATIVNAKDVILQAAGTRLERVRMPTSFDVAGDLSGTLLEIPVSTVLSDINYATSGDATKDILAASGTTIVVTSSTLFSTSASAYPAVFIGAGGIFSKNASNVTTFSLTGATGAAYFAGDVVTAGDIQASGNNTSTVQINVAGSSYYVDYSAYMIASTNASSGTKCRVGVLGVSTASTSQYNVGIVGQAPSATKGIGVVGEGGLYGVMGSSSNTNNPGVYANNTNSGGLALEVNGKMKISDSTKVTNLNAEKWNGNTCASTVAAGSTTVTQDLTNKPGASTSSNTWFQVNINGTDYVFPVWAK